MSREDQHLTTVTLIRGNGTRVDLGKWDNKSGGAVEAESTKYREGGMADEESLGGPVSTENVTLQRNYKLVRDHGLMPTLYAEAGVGRLEISEQPLDRNKVAFGSPTLYRGTLIAVRPPDRNSMSSDAAMVEIECEVAGLPA